MAVGQFAFSSQLHQFLLHYFAALFDTHTFRIAGEGHLQNSDSLTGHPVTPEGAPHYCRAAGAGCVSGSLLGLH